MIERLRNVNDDYAYRRLDPLSAGCVGFVMMLIFAAVGILMIFTVTKQRGLFAELDASGLQTQGIVMDHDSSSGKHYYLDVRYEASGPKQKSFDVAPSDFYKVRDQQNVTVEYKAEDPYRAKLAHVQMATYSDGLIPGGIVAMLIGVGVFLITLVYARNAPMADI